MRVAVPPIFEARICVSRNGTGSMPRMPAIEIAIGPTSRTVVTLSRKALSTAVRIMNSSMIFHPEFGIGLKWFDSRSSPT